MAKVNIEVNDGQRVSDADAKKVPAKEIARTSPPDKIAAAEVEGQYPYWQYYRCSLRLGVPRAARHRPTPLLPQPVLQFHVSRLSAPRIGEEGVARRAPRLFLFARGRGAGGSAAQATASPGGYDVKHRRRIA